MWLLIKTHSSKGIDISVTGDMGREEQMQVIILAFI